MFGQCKGDAAARMAQYLADQEQRRQGLAPEVIARIRDLISAMERMPVS